MDRRELINDCRKSLDEAEFAIDAYDNEQYLSNIFGLLDFLMVELIGGASNETQSKIDNANS